MRELGSAIRLPLRAAGQQQRAHRHGDADAHRRHVGLDELHRVVDRQPGVDRAAGRVDVERDVLVGVLGLQVEHLGDDQVGDLVVHGRAEEDDPLVEQPREDVELALAAGGALDDHRDERHVARMRYQSSTTVGAARGGRRCAGGRAGARSAGRAGGGPDAASSATSAGDVRSTSMASSARSSGSTRWAAASSCSRSSGGSAVPPRATTRIASKSSSGGAALSTSPSAPATRAVTSSDGSRARRCRARPAGVGDGAQAPAHGEPVAVQQLRVEQHDVRPLALHQLEPVVRAGRGADRHEARLGRAASWRALCARPAGDR